MSLLCKITVSETNRIYHVTNILSLNPTNLIISVRRNNCNSDCATVVMQTNTHSCIYGVFYLKINKHIIKGVTCLLVKIRYGHDFSCSPEDNSNCWQPIFRRRKLVLSYSSRFHQLCIPALFRSLNRCERL